MIDGWRATGRPSAAWELSPGEQALLMAALSAEAEATERPSTPSAPLTPAQRMMRQMERRR